MRPSTLALHAGTVSVAGFAAFKNHCSYFPLRGSVPGGEVDAYEATKGTLHFAVDNPLPKRLVHKLIQVRMQQAVAKKRSSNSGRAPDA